jgi:C4-type Zn-finger protein
MVADRSNECPNCNKNKDTIRINEWDVKGTIYVADHFIDVSYFHWVCKNCLYMWNQYMPTIWLILIPHI